MTVPFKSVLFQSKRTEFFGHYPDSQSAFTCPKLTIETPEQGVKYIQS